MRHALVTAACLAAAGPACAEPLVLKPLAELRIRYETVDQQGLPRDADALSFRLRGGLQATAGPWSALVEAQGTLAGIDRYDNGLGGASKRPLIADPQNVALYRAQIQYRSKAFVLTAGRQKIALDDERFVGNVGFRANAQTFDAVRAEITAVPKLKADISYVWSVRTIWGIDGNGPRQQAVSGDTVLANLSYATPLGALAGFAYLVDEDEAAVQGYRLSSQSYGVRFAGAHAFSKALKLRYQASYATQSDYHRNPNRYRADYYLVDALIDAHGVQIGGGYEVLGADRGAALTSFQTPLATGFKFQGWADKFLTTPPNGVRDLYASAGYGWKRIGPASAVSIQAVYHDFRSDRLGLHYGTEWDALASARLGPTTVSLRYADYRAKAFATDTRKFWVQMDWTL